MDSLIDLMNQASKAAQKDKNSHPVAFYITGHGETEIDALELLAIVRELANKEMIECRNGSVVKCPECEEWSNELWEINHAPGCLWLRAQSFKEAE